MGILILVIFMRFLDNIDMRIPFQYRKQYFDLVSKYLGLNPLTPEYIILAIDNGKVVGGIAIDKVYYCLAVVKYLVVDEEYRNRGIGTELLYRAEELLRMRGINVAFLTVNPKQTKASFYAKRGYRILGMFKNKYGNEVIAMYKII